MKQTGIFRSLFAAALLWVASAVPALAQSSPNWGYGFVPTPAQWNTQWASKQDYLGAPPLLTSGGTMTGRLTSAASNTTRAGFNIQVGVAPTTPADGDLWVTTAGLYARINGVTIGPITGSSSASFAATSPIELSFPAGITTYACSTCVTLTGIQTLTQKTLTSPAINTPTTIGGTHTAITSLGIRSTGSGAFDLTLANTENLTAGRTLTFTLNDANRTINLSGNFTMSGAFAFTGTLTNTTTVTFPTTGTLATIAGSETLTNKTITATTNVLGGVTMTLGSDANGDIYYRNSSGFLTRLAVGSNTQVLTVSSGLPSWQPGNAAASINAGTTTIAGTCSASQQLYSNAGVVGCANLSTFLTAGTGISFSGTTNVTITNIGVVAVKKQVFTAGGTYTPSAGLLFAMVECQGAGGAGGGVAGATSTAGSAGGGGAGSYSRVLLSAGTIGGSQIVTIGTGGTVGAAGNNAGNAGSASSVGTLCTANGGGGGGGSGSNGTGTPGSGGSAGTGDLAIAGGNGCVGFFSPGGGNMAGACGGASYFGGAATGSHAASSVTAGSTGKPYGGGGSGAAFANSTSTAAGGAGANGVVFITEYTSQ